MNTKRFILISFLLMSISSFSQNFKGSYKIDQLLNRTNGNDTLYVINFWATWCKPCVQELPAFDSLYAESKSTKVKVLLVSLDFTEDIETKVKPFLIKKNIQAECILLDEVNGNDFVNKISSNWSGAIPATLFKKGKQQKLIEKKMSLKDLNSHLLEFKMH